jgi:aspartyl-tRNA(Asn)/glutamyl-tRNA(Gln) amidotransferase subunit B
LLKEFYNTQKPIELLIETLNLKQITDKNIINDLLVEIIETNSEAKKQITERPDRAKKFIIGLLMKNTNGQANPITSNEVLEELFKKYNV